MNETEAMAYLAEIIDAARAGGAPREHIQALQMAREALGHTLKGEVEEGEYSYQRVTRVNPVEHYYGSDVIKYTCPVCDALGNLHQVLHGQDNCGLCNVRLSWEGLNETDTV